ncbi:MAG: (Fe-S)-binding protein [Candidatus Lokiarchaeota archaeon]|nr:(Fe-S)-binding protein [Candidatus Lokiarchaeota archaeon]MCK4280543.1 (Fe-S)-binding protein [Candidatus Lokiarchaeota archaeon]
MFLKDRCTVCGVCLMECPYLAYSEEKAKEEFKKLIDGEPTPITAECITCAACNMFCPEGANPFDLINDRQEETGTFKVTNEWIGMMKMASKLPSKIIKGDPEKPIMNLCSVGDILPGVIEGQLFDGMTLLKGGDYFCYFGWVHAGKPSMVSENAQIFVDNLAKIGAEEIICYHDDCYAMLTNKVKEFGIDLPFKPIHILEYLRDYVKEHNDQIKKLNMKVAYQQPCASRYAFEENDKILDELFELIGVERVDRKYDRIDAQCCGGVIAVMLNLGKEESNKWRMSNIMDAKEAGAEAMVFLCPLCVLPLRSRAKAQGLEPYIISNLVRLALGEKLTYAGAGKIYK